MKRSVSKLVNGFVRSLDLAFIFIVRQQQLFIFDQFHHSSIRALCVVPRACARILLIGHYIETFAQLPPSNLIKLFASGAESSIRFGQSSAFVVLLVRSVVMLKCECGKSEL